MRFLNITIDIPGKINKKKLSFTDGSNILSAPDPQVISLLSQIPVIGLYGKCSNGIDPQNLIGSDNYSIQIESRINDKTFFQSFKNGELQAPDDSSYPFFNIEDFTLFSLSDYDYPDGINDPVIDVNRIKSFFINREADREDRKEIFQLDDSIQKKEKELNELRKKKQLLELKKIKKDKLKKEISGSEKEINKLKKKKESYQLYRNKLDEIYKMTQESSRLSTKINNLKKDIIDIRELYDKSKSIEKELSSRFPQFSGDIIDKIPDLDILQNQFNAIRDINEQIDKYNSKKDKERIILNNAISGLVLFSVISIFFLLIKSGKINPVTSFFIGILTAVSLILAAAAGFYILFILKKKHPHSLLEHKTAAENTLLEIFKNSNFPVQDFATGELYEYLFQYFEDFLSFREMQGELSSIKKRFTISTTLQEKEDKLESVFSQKEQIENDIVYSLTLLDSNIHPVPAIYEIHNLIPDIDEMISDIEKEISHKNSITEKIEEEAKQYDSGVLQDSVLDNMISDIDSYIKKIRDEIEEIKILKQVFDESSESWFAVKLKTLSDKSAEIYMRIASLKDDKEKISTLISNLINNIDRGGIDPDSFRLIILSLRLALSEITDSKLNPPLILKEPFNPPGDEFVENIKKILLELSEKRQVVIITSADTTNLAGNIINI